MHLSAPLILCCVIIPAVHGVFKMMIIYAQPSAYTAFSNQSLSISACSDLCLTAPKCVAVYVEKGSKICGVFNIGQIQKLIERSSSGGHKMAVKMSAPSNTCAKTATTNSMTGTVTADNTQWVYKVVPSGAQWTFTTTSMVTCPANYRLFTREKGLWCISVISVNRCIVQTDATAKCKADGAILSGMESMEETNYVYGIGQALLVKTGDYERYGYWVNGARKKECSPPTVTQKTAKCNGNSEFSFTDPLLSTYGGYQWARPGQPDGIATPGVSECISLVLGKTILYGMDDTACDSPVAMDICYKGYACGIRPS